MSSQIIENIKYAYEAFNRGDIQGAIKAVDPDPNILWSEPEEFYAGGTYRGWEGVAEYLTLSYNASEKRDNEAEEVIRVGDKVFVQVHFRVWPKGGGEKSEGRIADVYTLHDEKVIAMQAYSDPNEARRVLGLPLPS